MGVQVQLLLAVGEVYPVLESALQNPGFVRVEEARVTKGIFFSHCQGEEQTV